VIHETEIERIRAVYIWRDSRIVPATDALTPGHQFWFSTIYPECLRLLHRTGCLPLDSKRIADIGCGRGNWLVTFLQYGAIPSNLAGVDLMPHRVEAARSRIPSADIRSGDACSLPWPDSTFDIVSQFVMFTSILRPDVKTAVAGEMLRVLRPGGAILWYDFRFDNPANPDVRGIGKHEIERLFPQCPATYAKVTLLPPLARRLARLSFTAAHLLHSIPWLRTHYLAILRKPIQL